MTKIEITQLRRALIINTLLYEAHLNTRQIYEKVNESIKSYIHKVGIEPPKQVIKELNYQSANNILKTLMDDEILDRDREEKEGQGNRGFIYRLKDDFKTFQKVVAEFEKFFIPQQTQHAFYETFGNDFLNSEYTQKFINQDLFDWLKKFKLILSEKEKKLILPCLRVYPSVLYTTILFPNYIDEIENLRNNSIDLFDLKDMDIFDNRSYYLTKFIDALNRDCFNLPSAFSIKIETTIEINLEEKIAISKINSNMTASENTLKRTIFIN